MSWGITFTAKNKAAALKQLKTYTADEHKPGVASIKTALDTMTDVDEAAILVQSFGHAGGTGYQNNSTQVQHITAAGFSEAAAAEQ